MPPLLVERAFCDRVTAVPETEATVVPGAMPRPCTFMPATTPAAAAALSVSVVVLATVALDAAPAALSAPVV